MARRSTSEVVVIMWRDIPAQVNGRAGEERHQVVLARRFQRAIDRAAMVADKKTAHEYVAEWRRTSYPVTGELAPTVEATAASLEQEFTPERLQTLIDNGGWD
ncbi:MAG TPA: virulence factor, partial [Ilumatobacteraceae bacterium]|nr:virulence factor [Ilumatobacteraceae bacterium]